MQIDLTSFFSEKSIKLLEEKYNAKYVCDNGHPKMDAPCSIFWQENPPNDHDNYLAVFWHGGNLYVRSGTFIRTREIVGAVANNGDVIFSRYVHDYRTSKDGSVWIDGGQYYVRSALGTKLVKLAVNKDKLEIVENDN